MLVNFVLNKSLCFPLVGWMGSKVTLLLKNTSCFCYCCYYSYIYLLSTTAALVQTETQTSRRMRKKSMWKHDKFQQLSVTWLSSRRTSFSNAFAKARLNLYLPLKKNVFTTFDKINNFCHLQLEKYPQNQWHILTFSLLYWSDNLSMFMDLAFRNS